jgi:ferrous iron transport protein B
MKIALVGNQNSGKTTLFNALTGANQKIGNWPGVTIERKEGILKGSKDISVVDLPGIYSFSPYTSEEDVSRQFVLEEKPDLIINIIDSTSLERSLYLTTQIMELDADVVLALNMSDILKSHGIDINVDELSKQLGASIVPISAKTGNGINELIQLILNKKYLTKKLIKIYPPEIEKVVADFTKEFGNDNKRFAAVKMIELDKNYRSLVSDKEKQKIEQLEQHFDMDSEQLIASKRYEYIETLKEKCLTITKQNESITDKLDRVFLNKWAAIPIFIVIMGIVYLLSIGVVGGLTTPLIDVLFNGASATNPTEFNCLFLSFTANLDFIGIGPGLGEAIMSAGGHEWAASLVENGIVAGVSAILSFVPQIIMMFICLSLLETTGYMSRIAFFLDRLFHKFGLSGKSLIPFIVGTGCSVPGIMSCRIVEDENERKSSIVLTPFMPCSAKLPIIALFASYFFSQYAWLITLSFYVMAISIILLFGWLFKRFIFKGEHSSFLVELPEYKVPSFKYVARDVFDKSWAFIKRAGTIIFLCSLVVWVLSSFTWTFQFVDGETVLIDNSILAGIGNAIAWIYYPMLGGVWSWGASVSALQGIIAKEQVISSMSVIAHVASDGSIFVTGSPFAFFTGWSAYAFLTFNLFTTPCFGALSAMRKELGSTKSFLKAIAFQFMVGWTLATIIGCIGWMVM